MATDGHAPHGTSPSAQVDGTPAQLLRVLRDAESPLVTLPEASPVGGGSAELAEVIRVSQQVINAATAVQDQAITRVAAIEVEELDDGTLVETHRAAGYQALDAPAIVAGALAVSTVHADRRVRTAVRLAADGPAGTSTETGLAGLHEEMRLGRLDSYRAGVVSDELEEAPPQVCAAVVAALSQHFGVETAAQLRRRCRRVLARISPDLLRQRARRAREQCGLRRWVEEPGVDRWEGTFPSEDAARAWAAVDALAQRLVADGTCDRIDRARAQALIDLVTGSATIDAVITLTVPADVAQRSDDDGDGPSDHGAMPREVAEAGPVAVERQFIRATADGTGSITERHSDRTAATTATQQLVDGTGPEATATEQLVDRVRVTSVSVPDASAADAPTGPPPDPDSRQRAGARACETPNHGSAGRRRAPDSADDLVEVWNGRSTDPMLVPREFLDQLLRCRGSTVVQKSCDPGTGALLDPSASTAYRPPPSLAALIRQRDGRCRFPGCHVNAGFCDIDHVRPWPSGPTDWANLVCLCRRHHRIKQRLGWRLRLAPDAVATWTDPTGRVRTSHPIDAVHTVVLRAASAASHSGHHLDEVGENRQPPMGTPPDVFSAVEFVHEHLCASVPAAEQAREAGLRQTLRHRGQPGGRPLPDLCTRWVSPGGRCRLVLDDTWCQGSRHGRTPRRGPSRPGTTRDDPPF